MLQNNLVSLAAITDLHLITRNVFARQVPGANQVRVKFGKLYLSIKSHPLRRNFHQYTYSLGQVDSSREVCERERERESEREGGTAERRVVASAIASKWVKIGFSWLSGIAEAMCKST